MSNITCSKKIVSFRSLTNLVDTGNLETKGASIVTASVHVVSEHKDQVKQLFEIFGVLQVPGSCGDSRNSL